MAGRKTGGLVSRSEAACQLVVPGGIGVVLAAVSNSSQQQMREIEAVGVGRPIDHRVEIVLRPPVAPEHTQPPAPDPRCGVVGLALQHLLKADRCARPHPHRAPKLRKLARHQIAQHALRQD